MKKMLLLVLISTVIIGGCNKKGSGSKGTTSSTKSGIKFRAGSFNSIMTKAASENKPIFLDFYTTWCAPCKWLDQDVFSYKGVIDYYNDNMINVKVDAEKGEGPKLAKKYGVMSFPTLIYLDSKGNVIEQHVGMTTISNVLGLAERTVQANQVAL